MIDDIELNDAESACSHDTSSDRSGKRPVVDIHNHSDSDHQGFKDFSIVLPPKIQRKTDDEVEDFTTGAAPSLDNVEEMDIVTRLKEKGKKVVGDIDKSLDKVFSDDIREDAIVDGSHNHVQKQSKDVYLSTIPKSAQAGIDAIMEGLAALIPPDFSDAVIAAHQAAKIPAKRIMTKSKVVKSPYLKGYVSGSKYLEDETTNLKHKFAFEGFILSDDMPRGVIEEYKKWIDEGL
ncbi:hypothetical protein FXO37_33729 [Capsicum annuum]|nr:hypothetical protein FXO37_33729 [Capsicum annuum]